MNATSYEELDQASLVSLLLERDHKIDKLLHQLSIANKREHGRKSEKLTAAERQQMPLFSFEPLPEDEAASGEVAEIEVPAHKREITRGRKPLPTDLPRERIECPPERTHCSCCHVELVRIGEEVTSELDYVPTQLVVKDYVKGKYACPLCQQDKVHTAPLPETAQPLERSRPGIGLLVFIIISKYVDHIPLYRLEQIFLRLGIVLSRQRMSDWLSGIVPKFLLLYRVLLEELCRGDYLQADETEMEVQDPEVKEKLFKGYLWGMHCPERKLAAFHYYDTRASRAPKELFANFKGVLQTDAYAGYNPVLLPEQVRRLACLAHVRRKFIDIKKAAPKESNHIVAEIAKLYALEKAAANYSAEKRHELRQKRAKPILENLHRYMRELHLSVMPKSPLSKALSHALDQWDAIALYIENGRYHIDNNAMEREIRPIAVGRKNYLFAGSHEGAQRAAVLYSFIACCRLNNVNSFQWFTDVLRRLPTLTNQQIGDILPDRWTPAAAQKPAEASAAA